MLKRTLQNFSDHLKEGGVAIIEPYFTKQLCNVGSPHMSARYKMEETSSKYGNMLLKRNCPCSNIYEESV